MQPTKELVIVPWQSIAEDTLLGLLEEFVTRDGTDYGATESTLDSRVAQAKRALQKQEVLIVVDLNLETTQLIDAREYQSYLENRSQ